MINYYKELDLFETVKHRLEEELYATGHEEGEHKKELEIVLNMLEENFEYDVIHKITKLPPEEIERIRQEHYN